MALDKNYLREMAKTLESKLPDQHGFLLLTFDIGEGGRITYTANAERSDCIKVLKEFLFQIGESENWMKHIK